LHEVRLWRSALPPHLAKPCVEVATEIGRRLPLRRNPEATGAAVASDGGSRGSLSLAQGDAGLALACGYLAACRPDEGWDHVAHRHLQSAAADAQQGPFAGGLFDGLAGLGFAAYSLSHGGTRYARLLASVDEALLPHALAQARRVARSAPGMSVNLFDLVSGLSGVGAYLIFRTDEARLAQVLDRVLDALVVLVRPVEGTPVWWTPAAQMPNPHQAAAHPHGHLNCGMAHGVPGVLALMTLALSRGRDVAGLAEAVERVALLLIGRRVDDEWGPNWPAAAPLTPSGAVSVAACDPARAGWCYGTPGVARSLWLAGVALDRRSWRDLAVEAMQAAHRCPDALRQTESPTFCHGKAGLLQATLRFFNDTGDDTLQSAARTLAERLLGEFDTGRPYGYQVVEPGEIRSDQPWLLDGSAGVAMVLMAAASAVEPTWDRAFLLS
jgi:lantibiotic biosynthesis protein